MEGTWRDAEDGKLEEYPIEQGSVDSTAQMNVFLKAGSEAVVYFWITAGKNLEEVETLHNFVVEENPEKLLKNSINYWKSWVNKEPERISSLPNDLKKHYKQSVLIMRTQIDNRGAIIAANDSDIMKFNKDTYTYMWPRDGGWVSLALDRAGYGEISKRFFEFCADVITESGYLLHKYNPDHSLGSSWHPWYKDGKPNLPIQEDETGIVVHALHEHFHQFGDIEFVQKMYEPLVKKPGNFMMDYVDKVTGLPLPSYDLWEREYGVFSYTAATVYAGLMAAAHLSEILGHFNHHRRYEKAASDIKTAILKHLYDEESGRFLKRIQCTEDGEVIKDYGLDASMHALWMFGVLPPNDERIMRTNQAIADTLSVHTIGGLARSENDDYQRVNADYHGIPGNPWIITTLWHAQWKLALAQSEADLKEVRGWIDWTIKYMNPAGLLPEQINPFNGDPLSVAPLTWSHATFVDTVLKYNEKLRG
ncbi:glycoside hydrolase family 15 protein [Candidatus Peregrinibacteria bacterium]|nr:MAG: glycoside hydrolase family 15 protein [Candidatus Peregrinibacteria bacterium]